MNKTFIGLVVCMLAFGGPLWAETFLVTSNLNSGPGTLREAIAASNTTTGVQTIAFAISNSIMVMYPISISSP